MEKEITPASDAISELREGYVKRSAAIMAAADERKRPLNAEESKILKDLAIAIRQLDNGVTAGPDIVKVITIGPSDRRF